MRSVIAALALCLPCFALQVNAEQGLGLAQVKTLQIDRRLRCHCNTIFAFECFFGRSNYRHFSSLIHKFTREYFDQISDTRIFSVPLTSAT